MAVCGHSADLAYPAWCRQYHCYSDYHVGHGTTVVGEQADATIHVYLAGEADRPMVVLGLEHLAARLSPADAHHLAELLTRHANAAEGHCERPV